MSTLGDLLRGKREKLGLRIQDIAQSTAIRAQWLELLEEGKFEEMPSYVHLHGFVSQYAKAVGLDFEKDVKPLLDEECPKNSFGQTEEAVSEEPASVGVPKFPGYMLISIVAVIIVLIVVAYLNLRSPATDASAEVRSEPVPIAELPIANDPMLAEPMITENSSAAIVDDNMTLPMLLDNQSVAENVELPETAPIAAEPVTFSALLTYTAPCWTYVESDSGNRMDFSAAAGDRRVVSFERFFRLDLGNAAAVTVTVNGEDLTNFGGLDQVVRNVYISLDNDSVRVSRTRPQ